MKRVVISQPMYFPWHGIFEQIRLADAFLHYDDVQLPQGRSFINRVQLKTASGPQWLTVPVRREGLSPIRDVRVDDGQRWREKHLKALALSYGKAPYRDEMLELAESVLTLDTNLLAEINITAIEQVAAYFGLDVTFGRSSAFGADAASSERLLHLTQALGGTTYITGHGARNYLQHELFEQHGIAVEYMAYQRTPYPQLHGPFDPHLTILDLIANVGRAGVQWLHSPTQPWRTFVHG